MKRGLFGVILLGFVLVVFMSGAVFAQDADWATTVEKSLNDFTKAANPIIKFIIGDVEGDSGLLFIKLMVFFLILVIVYYATRNVPGIGDKKSLSFIISLIVSIIAIRFLTTKELVNFIWAPYGVLGVALSSIFVFVLAFFFIMSFNDIIRKVGWTAFFVIYIGLAVTRWNDLIVTTSGPLEGYSLGWMYLIIAIISGLLILWDKKLKVMLESFNNKRHTKRKAVGPLRIEKNRKMRDLEEFHRDFAKAIAAGASAADITAIKKEIKSAKDAITELEKKIADS